MKYFLERIVRWLRPALFLFVLMFVAAAPFTFAYAQATADPTLPDWHVLVKGLIDTLTVTLAPFLVYGWKKVIPKTPRIAIPFINMLLVSPAIAWVFTKLTPAATTGYWEAIGLGVAGWALRETITTWQKYGVTTPVDTSATGETVKISF